MAIFKRQSRTDLSREQHTPAPERNSNSNCHNSTTSSTSHSHNYSPAYFFLFPNVDHAETKALPLLKVASKQLEAIQSRIKVPEAEAETEDISRDSDEIPAMPLLKVASRQLEAIQSQSKVPEAEAETEDSPRHSDEILPISQAPFVNAESTHSQIKVPEAEAETEDSPRDSDGIPPISQASLSFPHQRRAPRQRIIVGDNSRSKTLRPGYISAKRKGKRRQTEDTLNPKPEPENRRGVTRKKDKFVYFLYFLGFCALIFFLFLIFLFLIFLYVLHFDLQ